MFNVTYIESKNLFVVAVATSHLKKESKDRIREEITLRTGVEKVLVIEGSFTFFEGVTAYEI